MREQLPSGDSPLVASGSRHHGARRISAVEGRTKIGMLFKIVADHGEAQIDQVCARINGGLDCGGELGNIGPKRRAVRKQWNMEQPAIRTKTRRIQIGTGAYKPDDEGTVLAGRACYGSTLSFAQRNWGPRQNPCQSCSIIWTIDHSHGDRTSPKFSP